MHFNKKLIAVSGLLAATIFMVSMTTIQQPQQPAPAGQQQPPAQPKYTNLRILPKSIKKQQLDAIMGEWAKALGVRCNFCHAANTTGRGMNFASDAKPEKLMARKMFKMASKINKKYFHAEKDSLGLVALSSVNCNSCHRGVAHPKAVLANVPRPAGAPGAGPGGPGAVPRPAPAAPPATPVN